MAFDKCKTPPTDADLAISKPDSADPHLRAINREHRHWARQQSRAARSVDPAVHGLAIALHREFADFNRSMLLEALGMYDSRFAERDRRRILGSLALSRLFRTMLEAPLPNGTRPALLDGIGYRFSNFLGDMMADKNGMPLDHRLHMMRAHADVVFPPAQGVDEQWYHHDGLYVRRATAADPSDPIIPWLEGRNIQVPFEQMTTLFPAVASATTE